MKIVPVKDFLYSVDGVNPKSFKKGLAVEVSEKVGLKLKEAIGYIEGGAKAVEERSTEEDSTDLASLKVFNKIQLVSLNKSELSLEDIKKMSPEDLSKLDGFSKNGAEKILESLNK